MGLFENFNLKNQRKKKDEKIAKANQFIQAGEFEKAGYILHDIVMDSRDTDPAYRYDEIENLLEATKMGAKQQKLHKEEKPAPAENIVRKEKTDADIFKAAQKDEALSRIESLVDKVGLDALVLDCWRDGGCQLTYCDFDESYVGKAEDMYLGHKAGADYVYKAGDVDWIDEVKAFEEKEDSLVYHVIQQSEGLYFLFVGSNRMFWGEEKLIPNDGSVFANVTPGGYNISAYFCSSCSEEENDFVDIELFGNNGILTAKRALENIDEDDDNAEECADNKEVCTEADTLQDMQKQEALNRLDTLAKSGVMDGKPYIWLKNGRLCGSVMDDDGVPYIKELDKNDDLYMLAKQFEEELGCMVYHAVDSGSTAYLLTVHRDADRWEEERPDGDRIEALIFSFEEDDYHYDYVNIFNSNGALGIRETEQPEQEEYCLPDMPEYLENPVTAEFLAEMKAETFEEADENSTEETAETDSEYTEEETEKATGTEAEKTDSDAQTEQDTIDGKNAAEWYSQGYSYYYGKDVEQNYSLALAAFENGASLGGINAMFNCAVMYTNGLGCEKDLHKAFLWSKKGADAGDAEMMWGTAKCYYNGKGCEKNMEKSCEYTIKAAENGHSAAYLNAAIEYYTGNYVQQDYAKALYWFEKSAMSGDSNAMEHCGNMYGKGLGCEKDTDKANYWLNQALQHGNPSVMAHVAMNKYSRAKTAEEYKEIYETLALPAAEKGNADAMFIVSGMLYNGEGVEQDVDKGIEWLEKAAIKGHSEACRILAEACKADNPTEEQKKQYYFWLEKYAESGNIEAMVEYGEYCMLEISKVDEETARKGFEMLKNAARQDNIKALLIVGEILYQGDKCDEALTWYERAEELGSIDAMKKKLGIYLTRKNEDDYQKAVPLTEKLASITGEVDFYRVLGSMYHLGKGCQRDIEKSIENFTIASEMGDLKAKRCLVDIYSNEDMIMQHREKIYELGCQLADAGDAAGRYILGVAHIYGNGCEKDYKKALDYLEQAAGQDHAPAWYVLGECYKNGLGCEKDNLTAIEMYIKAAEGGVQQAFERINSMDEELKQELERGKKIAEKYIDSPDPEMRQMARELLDAQI
ncbi:MAG: sel1 repeat family protein [Oscillospiraceae bacterium]|nr:sel1 repeat family protein [Oscillospiraceae bacterium]